jgi:hypothetical protein
VSHISVKPSPWALLGVKTMKILALHFFFNHDTPRVSSGYLESWGKKYEKNMKKKRAVVSKNLILAFVGITFFGKTAFCCPKQNYAL